MILAQWAIKWGVPAAALADLERQLGLGSGVTPGAAPGRSEASVQAAARVTASQQGWRLFRNNVGVLKDARGVPVRYGLANESPTQNASIKSADLIGVIPLTVTPQMVGHRIGVFGSIECKHEGWQYSGDNHEKAQLSWALLVLALGGYARFVSNPSEL